MVQRGESDGSEVEWVFRHCAPDHADLDETVEKSREVGGRYNPRGEFGAIYAACGASTAIRELDRRAAGMGLTRGELLPRLLLTIHLRLRKVLDLTDTDVRRAWGVTQEEITGEDHTLCHEIARAARRDGYEAIRFPAFTDGEDGYAVFLDRLKPGSHLVVEDRRFIGDDEEV